MGRSGYDCSEAAPGSAANDASLRARARRAGVADVDATPRASRWNPAGFQPQATADLSARELGSPSAPQAATIPSQQGQKQAPYQAPNHVAQTGYPENYAGFGSGSAANVGFGTRGVDSGHYFMPQVAGGAVIPDAVATGFRPVIPDEVSIFSNSRGSAASSATSPTSTAFNYSASDAGSNHYQGSAYSVRQSLLPTTPVATAVPVPGAVQQTGNLPMIEEETAGDVEMADSDPWPGHTPKRCYENWGPDGR